VGAKKVSLYFSAVVVLRKGYSRSDRAHKIMGSWGGGRVLFMKRSSQSFFFLR
jgi:hypothetical protein